MIEPNENKGYSEIEIANLVKAMNMSKCSFEEADRCIRILAKKPKHDKQHPFKKYL